MASIVRSWKPRPSYSSGPEPSEAPVRTVCPDRSPAPDSPHLWRRPFVSKHVVTLLPGDGIGPEVVAVTVRAIDALDVDITWEEGLIGESAMPVHGTTLPPEVLDSIRRNGCALKGPTTTPVGGGHVSVNVGLRRALSLFANFRPIRNIPGVDARYENVDLFVVRENTEGLYRGIEHVIVPGVVESLKVITAEASTRISRFAFEFARNRQRRKVTAVHKANIMKLSDGLFLDCSRAIAKEYPEIEYEELIVDNMCMQLVMDPTRFDVLLSENLYGDILSDLCAGLVGGLGFAPGANHGEKVGLYEPVHGSAPDIAGKNLANPIASVLSGVMMLRHLKEHDAADRLKEAVFRHLAKAQVRTRDMGGTATTTDVGDSIVREIESAPVGT
ncbi:MAG: isocitrate/isopropylmalate dehydrogenase family protein [Gemmatimonadetes bacterium]|nr:isocitrate/isopropylmalate dehydrogenase family protein [Gemmatimonadota bacterium]